MKNLSYQLAIDKLIRKLINFSVLLASCCGSRYFLAQSQQQKQWNKISDMFQVSSNRTTSTDVILVSFLLTLNRFTLYARVFTVDFEHVTAGLDALYVKLKTS